MPDVPAPFMVVGMIACFGSVAHAPLGLMLMVAEMTGSLALLPPAMVAIGLATLVVGDDSIYESQLRSRADSPAHRAAFGLPLLSSVMVGRRDDTTTARRCPADTPLERGPPPPRRPWRCRARRSSATTGEFVGVLSLGRRPHSPTIASRGRRSPTGPTRPFRPTEGWTSPSTPWCRPASAGSRSSTPGSVVGIVAMNEVIGGYQHALRRSLRLLADVRGGSVLVEAPVAEDSPFAGTTVAHRALAAGQLRPQHRPAQPADRPHAGDAHCSPAT